MTGFDAEEEVDLLVVRSEATNTYGGQGTLALGLALADWKPALPR